MLAAFIGPGTAISLPTITPLATIKVFNSAALNAGEGAATNWAFLVIIAFNI